MANSETVLHQTVITNTDIVNQIWQAYIDSFAGTDDFCAQDQICYTTKAVMAEALKDPDYQKFILKARDKIIGLCLLTNNLVKARIAYCNDRFLRKKFPKFTKEGRLFYVTAICVLPDWQTKGYGIKLLESVINFIDENKSMVAYDFSENKNGNLPDMIIWVAKERNRITILREDLDRQCYTTLFGQHHETPS